MGDGLIRYGPPVLAWGLFLFRRGSEDRGRRSVRWVFLWLAVSLTALTAGGQAAIRAVTGAPDLPRLIGHGAMLLAAWSAVKFLAHMNERRAGLVRHSWWIVGMFVVMCVLFALTPDLRPQSPWVMEYCFAYAAAQLPALVAVITLVLRYSRITADPFLRLGLWLVATGTTAAAVYLVNKTILAASPRFGFAYPLGREFVVGQVLPPVAHVLVLVGIALPAIAGWISRYRTHRRLWPLWRALFRADPAIALDPPRWSDVLAVTNLRLRQYRRVIEIRDGLLALRPYRDPKVARAARETAAGSGMGGKPLEAEVEAVAVAAALEARAAGTAPVELDVPLAGGGDLDSDTTFLSDVAHAYRRLKT